jgi:tetratricopeptide (TPR) repeat protein
MMHLQFWRTWPRSYQRVGAWFGVCLLGAVAALWTAWFLYPQPTFTWQHVQEQLITEIPLRTFSKGLAGLVIPAENYVIFDQLVGGEQRFYPVAAYVFVALFFFSFSLLLAIITTLSRFAYLVAMTGVIVLVISLRLEVLLLFGSSSQVTATVLLLLLVSLTALFQFFKKEAGFVLRWLAFLLLLAAAAVLIYFFAGVKAPFLHLAVAIVPVAIAGAAVFILLVAHEILAALVSVVSRGFSPTHSLRHVVVISVIYFVNLALAYADRFSILKLGFIYIDFFLLLTLSGIVGLWGFRQRRQQVGGFLEEPFATLAYLAVALVCFSTIAFFWWTANDPVLDALGNLSVFAHLGFGLMFFLYVLSNFGSMLEKNLEVHKVLYKPTRMPYFTYRFAGLVATGAFLIYTGWQGPLHNAIAGFFNAAGDLYQHLGDEKSALAFYQRGGNYGFLNHKSNYNIAVLESRFFNFGRERNFYNRASERRPTEMSVVNHAFTYQKEGQTLDALLALGPARRGASGPAVENMKGVLYKKLNLPDSAARYFLRSARHPTTRAAARMNLIGLAVERGWPVSPDSALAAGIPPDAGVQSNLLALANSQRQLIDLPPFDFGRDTALNLFTASWLHNHVVNQTGKADTAYLSRVAQLAGRPANGNFQEVLLTAVAKGFYEAGEVEKALRLVEQVIYFSAGPGKYNNLLALWAIEQNAPDVAVSYLRFAAGQLYGPAALTMAVALAEARQTPAAIQLWDSLQRAPDTLMHQLASRMVRVLAIPPQMLNRLTDEEKAAYVHYRLMPHDSAALFGIVQSMQDANSRVRALLSFSSRLFYLDEIPEAVRIFQRIGGQSFSDEALYGEILRFELALHAALKDYRQLADKMGRVGFAPFQNSEKRHYEALLALAEGRNEEAEFLFEWLARSNPFYATGITDAARFYSGRGDRAKAYAVLAEALQRNPRSVKILKAYVPAAAQSGYTDYARSALNTLRQEVSPQAFSRFLIQHKNLLPQ